ncbi:MAG: hypothetical protein GF331_18655 [Chitinivibrionales bacterium]|nr:hypothetical protein [Chitinivibrionales bacterium]
MPQVRGLPCLQLCDATAQEWESAVPTARPSRSDPSGSPTKHPGHTLLLALRLRALLDMKAIERFLDKNGYPLRWSVAVVAGIIAGSIVAAVSQGALRMLYVSERAALDPAELTPGLALEPLPELALVLVLEGWVLAGLTGGAVCSLLAPIRAMAGGWAVGGMLTIYAVASVVTNHHPLWFSFAATAVFIPSALAGAFVASRW